MFPYLVCFSSINSNLNDLINNLEIYIFLNAFNGIWQFDNIELRKEVFYLFYYLFLRPLKKTAEFRPWLIPGIEFTILCPTQMIIHDQWRLFLPLLITLPLIGKPIVNYNIKKANIWYSYNVPQHPTDIFYKTNITYLNKLNDA